MIKTLKDIIGLVQMTKKEYFLKQLKCFTLMLLYTMFSLAFPSFIGIIVDKGIIENNISTIIIQCCYMVLCGILMILFLYLQQISIFKLAQEIVFRLKQNIFEKLTSRTLKFWEKYTVGDIITTLEGDVGKIETLLTSTFSNLIVNALTATGIAILLTVISPVIGLTVFILSLIFAYFQRKTGKGVETGMAILREEVGGLSSTTNEILNHLPVIQMADLLDLEKERFTKMNQNVVVSFMLQMRKITLAQLIGLSFNVFGIFFVLIIGAFEVSRGAMSVGVLFTMTVYVQRLYGPVVALGSGYIAIKNAKPIINKLVKVMENEDTIIYGNNTKKILNGKINIKSINFRYQEKTILKDFHLVVDNGETIAIIGENGSGKSTLLKILAKICTPQEGEIKIGDVDISDFTYQDFQKNIAIVPQNCFLPKGTLKEIMNVENQKKEEILYSLMSKLGIEISKFPNGIETEIAENMRNLSGGEIQKLCLIRSILQDKKIYAFDEPTAAMDIESEKRVCEVMKEYLEDKTVIIITHRQEILPICNRIIELQYLGDS